MVTWPSGDPNQPYGAPPPYQGPGYPPPPPPLPYQQGPYGQPGQYGQPPAGLPYPPPKKKSRTGLIIGLSALAVVLVGGLISVVVLLILAKDRVVATDIEAGSCIADVPTSARIATLPTVDCAQPHGGEVYAVLTMPDGDYPGPSVIDTWQNKCPSTLAGYSPEAMLDDSIGVFVLYPTQETWDAGDRAITCIATFDPKRVGTLK